MHTFLSLNDITKHWICSFVVPCPSLLPPPSSQISALHWDHNDNFNQFSGSHALLPRGYSFIFSRLAEGLQVHLRTPVTAVRAREGGRGGVVVVDGTGKEWTADKVSFVLQARGHILVFSYSPTSLVFSYIYTTTHSSLYLSVIILII